METQAWFSQEMEVGGKVHVEVHPEQVLAHQQEELVLVVSLDFSFSSLAEVEVYYRQEVVDLTQLHSTLEAVAFLVVLEKHKEPASQNLPNRFPLFSSLF